MAEQSTRGCFTCRNAKPTFSYRNGVMQVLCRKKNVVLSEQSNCYYHVLLVLPPLFKEETPKDDKTC